MKKTGFLYDERFLLHRTGPFHPEAPERLEVIHRAARQNGLLGRLVPIAALSPDPHRVEAVHSIAHIRRFEEICLMGRSEMDHPDNQICEETFATAMLAVGGVLEAVRMVMEREIDNAFCAVRPPGHHAEEDRAMGFCFLNNIAIAARYLQTAWGLQRIGIVDFDVHHGNGTQHIFEKDPGVFFYSIHEHPTFAYPGTGREFERGTGQGLGFTLNSPILPGEGDDAYRHAFEKDLIPAFDRFEPEFILVSTGFDAHAEDDMSNIQLSTAGFSWVMEKITDLAERHAGGRLVSVLEGGYCLERLPELTRNHLEILLGVERSAA
ncbi:Histone deacetylase domain containing protein [uncultured Desulfatiglans sp.]|nr:Histone deacetylase domain containing protein [uncultured Desulfatiglans sp.]